MISPRRLLFGAAVLALSLLTAPVFAQMEVELAKQYFEQGEFEKAGGLYQKLYDRQPANEYYLTRYLESLAGAKRYDEADKTIRRALKEDPERVSLLVQQGQMLEDQGEVDEAKKVYADALKRMPAERFAIQKLANAFAKAAKYELSAQAYEQGGVALKDKAFFAYYLGGLYQQLNQEDKMIENYLLAIQDKPQRMPTVQGIFSRSLDDDGLKKVQVAILQQVQGDPDNEGLVELLVWSYIQQRDYRSAMRQVRALDLRNGEDGQRIFRLATTALIERQFLAAQDGFAYIIEKKGPRNPFYIDAKRLSLDAERQRLLSDNNFDRSAFEALEQQYEAFLAEAGLNSATASIAHELALLRAYQLDKRGDAIALLKQVLAFPLIDDFAASLKLTLADLYLMEGERWESTLLYGQVDKAFPEGQLGHEARFRNARLSYFSSDFEWAQEQFDILKSSTSRLIANDAIDMSVFIMDNLNLDTTSAPLAIYAAAELLTFQRKFGAANLKLDSLTRRFPEHGLVDDIIFMRGDIEQQQAHYPEAIAYYRRVVTEFPQDIRADNALFRWAEIAEKYLGDPASAKTLYERLFLEYDNSILAVEARKRFRRLRGDELG